MTSIAQQTMIEIRNLTKNFGSFTAIENLSLSIPQGEIFGLLGPNGAGKTTTIRLLLGLEIQTAGEILVGGLPPQRGGQLLKKKIGWVPQNSSSDPLLSGREQLRMIAELYRVDTPGPRVDAALEKFGLTEAANRKISTYSGGMQKRLELAAGTLHQPELLILDEPTAGLDVQTRHQIWDMVREMNAAGTTVLITTHYLDEADLLCDRVAIIDRGRLRALGTPQTLKNKHSGSEVHLQWTDRKDFEAAAAILQNLDGLSFAGMTELTASIRGIDKVPSLDRLFSRLNEAQVPLPDTITTSSPTLDQVFAQLTGRDFDPVTGNPLTDEQENDGLENVSALPDDEGAMQPQGNSEIVAESGGINLGLLISTFLRNNQTFLKRWYWRLKRDRFTLGLALLQPALWLILFGNLWEEVVTGPWTGDGYLQFITAGAVMMTVFNFGLMAGLEVVVDRERGALDRLIAAPVVPVSLITSRVIFVAAIGSLQSGVMIIVASAMGVEFESGPLGIFGLMLIAALLGGGVAATSVSLAFIVKNHGQFYTTTGLAALPLILISTVFAPLDVMPDWLAVLARLNPMSYAVTGARSLVLEEGSLRDVLASVGILVAFITIILSIGSYSSRKYLRARR